MRLLRRLRSQSGESFTELLCAVLIVAVAVALLAAMVNSSARLNTKAIVSDEALYSALSDAESGGEPIDNAGGAVTVTVTTSSGAVSTVDFDVSYSGSADEMASYFPKSKGG